MNFKDFFIENNKKEEKKSLVKTLKKIPKKHRDMLIDYDFKYQNGLTLKNDKENVGMMFNKNIVVCSPWLFSKEFTTLHEIGHVVWSKLSQEKKQAWVKLNNKNKITNIVEEDFCMYYASYYSDYSLNKYNKEDLLKFIKSI